MDATPKVKREPAAEDGDADEKKGASAAGKLQLRPRAPPTVFVHADPPKRTQLTLQQTVSGGAKPAAAAQTASPAPKAEGAQPPADAARGAGVASAGAAGAPAPAGGADAEADEDDRREGETAMDWVTRVNNRRFPARQLRAEEERKGLVDKAEHPKKRKAGELEEDKLSELDAAAHTSYLSTVRMGCTYAPLDPSEQTWLILELRRRQGHRDDRPGIAEIRTVLSKGKRGRHLGANVQEEQLKNFYTYFCRAAAGQRAVARDVD